MEKWHYYTHMPYKDPKDPRQKEAQRQWYIRNRTLHMANTKVNKEKGKDTWRSFKTTLKCALCTENHPWTLDFHHVVRAPDNKKVHKLVSSGSYKKAIKEIRERCVVLCANCHRKGHYYEKHPMGPDEQYYAQYEQWFDVKKA
jgi:hypothetical protein